MSKILEELVTTLLGVFLWSNYLFEVFQSGFQKYHSAQSALTKVTINPLITSDEELLSSLVLLDLGAAFDTIEHQILIERLDKLIDIKGAAFNHFKSYLLQMIQFVHVSNDSSMYTEV